MALIEHRMAHNAQPLRNIGRTLRARLTLWRTRRALARLDAHLLKDIGVTPEQARHEAEQTIWDVPANWTLR